MTEPDHSQHSDELLQRYREASAEDTRRPGAHVRDAVRAHAQMVINAGKQTGAPQAAATADAAQRPAANQSRWKISALASVALVGLTGLLVLQFDRGNDQEKELVFGRPSPTAQPSPATSPSAATAQAPSPSMATVPDPVAPQTPAPEPEIRKRSGETAKPALKSPAPPVLEKSAASPPANEAAVQKEEAKAPPGGVAAPPPAPSPLPAPAATPVPPATVQDSAQPPLAPYTTGAGMGSLTASLPPSQANTPAAAPVARAAPAAPSAAVGAAAPAARAVAPQQKQENALQYRAPRAEAGAGPNRLAGALQDAARAGRLELIERLLQQGAPVNAADAAGRTPLVLAVMQGHTAVVQRLLAAGANPALVDQEGLNALQHARRLGLDGIARLIEAAS